MPWSVFFADGGIAFHEGDPDTFSAGCVKLDEEDARAFFASCRSATRYRSYEASGTSGSGRVLVIV